MFTSQQYRTKAREFGALLASARTPAEVSEYRALQQTYTSYADNLDWMAANAGSIVSESGQEHREAATRGGPNSGSEHSDPDAASKEDNMLRCLGAAVILNWYTIPTKLQRSLFDDASSINDVQDTPSRAALARFLHDNRRDARTAG